MMTILDATHKLFEYFASNHSFCLEKNFKDVIPISEEIELDKAILRLALSDMEKNEMVKSTVVDEDEYYILGRPFESFDQSVTLTYTTAYMVASSLHEFCEAIEDYTDAPDVSSITEKDIKNLVILNQHHRAEMTKLLQDGSENNSLGGINFDNI